MRRHEYHKKLKMDKQEGRSNETYFLVTWIVNTATSLFNILNACCTAHSSSNHTNLLVLILFVDAFLRR